MKLNKGESITSYFTRITELKDQLSTIGHLIDSKELTMLALNGLPASWEGFIQGSSACSKLPKFDRLQIDCIQVESKLIARGDGQSPINKDIHVLNSSSHKKGKKKNIKRKKDKDSRGKYSYKRKRDMTKVQCFRCDQYGHHAIKCSDRPRPQATVVEVSKSRIENDSENLCSTRLF